MTRLPAITAALILLIILALYIPSPGAPVSANDGDNDQASPPPKPTLAYPNLGSELDRLVTGAQPVEGLNKDTVGGALISQGGDIAVTIHLSGHVSEVVAFLNDNGGDPRNVGTDYIEAYVPISLLGTLSEQPGVLRVRKIIPPQPAQLSQQVIGHGPAVHGTMPWNDAGYNGQGIKVGIIDDFFGYSALRGIEVPSSVVVRCYTDIGVFTSNLADCDQETEATSPWPECLDAYEGRARRNASHGTIVAESVLDLAPGVTLYIANPGSRGDMQDAVAWMASEGVQVINYSAGWIFDGPGDGTSPSTVSPLNTVDQAVANDIIWLNSAGNSADGTWFGGYSDPDGNNAIGFGGSNDEIIDTPWRTCSSFVVQLRWEDSWTGAGTDLDLHIIHKPTGSVLFSSDDPQSGQSGQVPHEWLGLRTRAVTNDFGVAVSHRGGPVPDWIQIVAWTGEAIQYHTLNGSITNPAESANPGLLAVGAAPWYDVQTIEFFSSRGPAPDGRNKPEIAAADCGETALTPLRPSNRGFCGTSQASPHVAGMAALVRQRFPDMTAEQVAAYLMDHAQPRGAVPNNTWGYGFAQLPAAAVGDCVNTITADGPIGGQWSAACQSGALERGFAQYYTFTLPEPAQVTIALESSVDPYLFLRAGEARSGSFLYENDDIESGNTNSHLTASLPAGTYTIEATTYNTREAGPFTLTFIGFGTVASGTDPCAGAITEDGSTSGSWAAGCQSSVSDRGYARYYTFTLDQESAVTIDLESTLDTFLYLREGEARSGTAPHFNDDIESGNLNSRISQTLAAGTYTIEATTYAAATVGTFTLTVSGLSGTTVTDPDPAPGTDPCAIEPIADVETTGAWAADCQSRVSERGYARYYTFTLDQESAVTIDLESSVDTFLYLREGEARSGTAPYFNDDIESGNLNSRISQTLEAGTYTIEATTYAAATVGTFTLTVSGLSGTTDIDPDPTPGTDPCAAVAVADGETTGAWAADCQSQVSDRGYARYYTFTLDQESAVTIDLVSSVDPYLFLREGDARSGGFLYENDDVESGVNLNSRISQTLEAGTYTIEATTYAVATVGNFTLTISGLAGTTTTPGGGTDPCAIEPIADGESTGAWAADCQSRVSDRGYARYYTFTLAQESAVTIDLVSSVDTYLFLRVGDARGGGFLYENDDIESGNLNSRISQTLEAGTYTIEATTYPAATVGNFTLTVAGLG